ncbi:MAG: MgtC/SapB family protein [bacterium]|nr:MgtC/SapB family protein [bacterium]
MVPYEVFGQLILAVILGSVIGFERRLAHKNAGVRTFAMVSLGAALFTIISGLMYTQFGASSAFDPGRIASQVVVGIGFLAGGMIIFNHQKLEGLTTSAGLWVAGGIGMAVGLRFYAIAIFTAILILIIFEFFQAIEHRLIDGSSHDGNEHDH